MAQDVADLEEIPVGRADTDPRWDLHQGQEIDKTLVVIAQLGTGSRYEVYRAWDRSLFCEVAVKVVRPHRVDEERAISGFDAFLATLKTTWFCSEAMVDFSVIAGETITS